MSNGEKRIFSILKKANIYFEIEKTFYDLKHGLLRFDFYIDNYNGRKIAIEFQGQQHYEFTSYFFKSRKEFQHQQGNDRRKISYCLANNIELYCIPFWEYDNLNSFESCINIKYLARDKWKNDDDWNSYKN